MIIREASRAPLTTKPRTTFFDEWHFGPERMHGSFWTVIRCPHWHSSVVVAFSPLFFRLAHKGVVLFSASSGADGGLATPQIHRSTSGVGTWAFFPSLRDFMMERIRKEMILMERGLHSPVAAKRLPNLSESNGNAVLEALENSQHAGRLSPRITSATLHASLGDVPSKGKFEIDSLFGNHHTSDNSSSAEISSSENRNKPSLYPEVSTDSEMNSDVEVGCPSHRSPNSVSQHKENNSKGNAQRTFNSFNSCRCRGFIISPLYQFRFLS